METSRSTTASSCTIALLLLFLSLRSPCLAQQVKCHAQDKNALLKIKAALNNPTSFPLGSWDPDTDCCSWDLVYCDPDVANGRVTNVNILNVTGVPPGRISPAIGDLTYLDTLYMDDANLVGPIPPTFAKLKRLTFVRMTHNQLSGPFPALFSELKEITAIVLSYNNLSGTLSPSLSKLTKLLTLSLNHNRLAGPIPESWGRFTGVIPNFDLSHNFHSGTIPKSFGPMNNYYTIDLSHNNFVGDASLLFGKNKTTNSIYLNSNGFEFDLSNVEFPRNLNDLDISHNRIYGSLPHSLTQLSFLTFNVSYNMLCGPIPQGGSLQKFDSSAYDHNRCLCGPPLPPCK